MRYPIRLLLAGLAVIFIITVAFAHSTFTGKTQKTISTGCSGSQCHAVQTTSVIVAFSGPDTIVAGKAANYSLKISGGAGTQVACDIATSAGTLATVDKNMLAAAGELTSNGAKTFSNGSYTYNFKLTAPAAPQQVTLYANGLSSHTQFNFAPNKTITVVSAVTGVNDAPLATAQAVELFQNYPNPVGGGNGLVTTIGYNLAVSADVHLAVYDEMGREKATLVQNRMDAGMHQTQFDASQLSAGVYFCRITAATENGALQAKMTRINVTK